MNVELNKLKDELQNILDTEEGLNIPIRRKEDYMWLLRNFQIQNSNHPACNKVMSLLRNIAKLQMKNKSI